MLGGLERSWGLGAILGGLGALCGLVRSWGDLAPVLGGHGVVLGRSSWDAPEVFLGRSWGGPGLVVQYWSSCGDPGVE